MLKAIKIRLYLNNDQKDYVNNLLGTTRFVYNHLLAYKINKYNTEKENVSFATLGKVLTELKSEHEWIKNSHSKVLQQSLINMEFAYKSFFKNGNGFPKFKSKKDTKQSCRFPSDAIGSIKGNRINIIRQLKDIHFKCSLKDEKFLNKKQKLIRSATLTKTKYNTYFLSILIDKENKVLQKPKNNMIAIDLGIKDFIITSENTSYENIKVIRNNQKKLAKLHKNLSRKQKGSKNKEKSRMKLAKFNDKLHNIKDYYLHSITNSLLNENQIIVMENLNVQGMLKNHKLAKSLQELSLNKFKQILTYKALWYNRDIIEIDRFFPSSKLCSCCGYKNQDLTLNQRTWTCPSCGSVHDRDFNAAKNILAEGKRIQKIGSSSPELTPTESKSLDPR